jgi:hypothetical protein
MKEKTAEKDLGKARFVAVTVNYWGRGETAEEAEKNLKAAGGAANARKYGIVIKLLPEGATDAYVDDFGAIHWSGVPGATVEVKNTARAKKQAYEKAHAKK